MSDSPAAPARPMKYPYTFSAKIAQFPFKFHWNNITFFRYWLIAVAVTAPVFYKIGQMSHSPANVRNWEEIRRKAFTPGGHH